LEALAEVICFILTSEVLIHLADTLQLLIVICVQMTLEVLVVACIHFELKLHLVNHRSESLYTQLLGLLVFILGDHLEDSLAQVDVVRYLEEWFHLLVDMLLIGHYGLI